jgi:chromosome segregation ATPase
MKRRDSALRLKRFRVDEYKRRLATLDEMRADLERKLADLEDSVAREKQRASDSEIGRLAFPSFLQSIENRRRNIRSTMHELEREQDSVENELSTAIQELKSFEIAEQERERRVGEAAARTAQSKIENMALIRHLRKHAARRA